MSNNGMDSVLINDFNIEPPRSPIREFAEKCLQYHETRLPDVKEFGEPAESVKLDFILALVKLFANLLADCDQDVKGIRAIARGDGLFSRLRRWRARRKSRRLARDMDFDVATADVLTEEVLTESQLLAANECYAILREVKKG